MATGAPQSLELGNCGVVFRAAPSGSKRGLLAKRPSIWFQGLGKVLSRSGRVLPMALLCWISDVGQ
eukprot:15177794-Alexandrium_andersonii.AAC.1